jgi:hypothetical protein
MFVGWAVNWGSIEAAREIFDTLKHRNQTLRCTGRVRRSPSTIRGKAPKHPLPAIFSQRNMAEITKMDPPSV